jgi:hypothetical protein
MLESDHQGVLAYAAPLEDLDRFRYFWEITGGLPICS